MVTLVTYFFYFRKLCKTNTDEKNTTSYIINAYYRDGWLRSVGKKVL